MTGAESGDSAPATRPLALAALLSAAFHPLLLIPVTIVALTRDIRLAALIAAVSVLPLLAVTLAKVRRGTWRDFDVSDRRQRRGLYAVALPLTLGAAAVLSATGGPSSSVRGTLIVAGMLAVAFAISRFIIKVSLHLMFAAWSGVLLSAEYPLVIAAVPVALAAVAWARRRLERHTLAEVIVGGAIGIAGGILALVTR